MTKSGYVLGFAMVSSLAVWPTDPTTKLAARAVFALLDLLPMPCTGRAPQRLVTFDAPFRSEIRGSC